MAVMYFNSFFTQKQLNWFSEGLKRIEQSWLKFEFKKLLYIYKKK